MSASRSTIKPARSTTPSRRSAAMNPLPSLIRAAAWDAAENSARHAGRHAWAETDYNEACATQERLIDACYGRQDEDPDSPRRYIRFSLAEQMERAGTFTLSSDFAAISVAIDQALDA